MTFMFPPPPLRWATVRSYLGDGCASYVPDWRFPQDRQAGSTVLLLCGLDPDPHASPLYSSTPGGHVAAARSITLDRRLAVQW